MTHIESKYNYGRSIFCENENYFWGSFGGPFGGTQAKKFAKYWLDGLCMLTAISKTAHEMIFVFTKLTYHYHSCNLILCGSCRLFTHYTLLPSGDRCVGIYLQNPLSTMATESQKSCISMHTILEFLLKYTV